MEIILMGSKERLFVDEAQVFLDPKAEGRKYLKERGKTVMQRNLDDFTDEELYAYKDRLKAKRIVGRGPEQDHERQHRRKTIRKINAILKRRKLPATRPDDGRVYGPGAARFQRAGGAT